MTYAKRRKSYAKWHAVSQSHLSPSHGHMVYVTVCGERLTQGRTAYAVDVRDDLPDDKRCAYCFGICPSCGVER